MHSRAWARILTPAMRKQTPCLTKCKLPTVTRCRYAVYPTVIGTHILAHYRYEWCEVYGCGYTTYISNHCTQYDASFDPRMHPWYYHTIPNAQHSLTLLRFASRPSRLPSPSLATHRDTDGSGAIDFDEFIILYGKIKAGGLGQESKGMFGSLMSGVKSQWKETMPAVVGGDGDDGDDGESKRDVVSFTEDEVENLRTVFEQMDEDGSGEVRFQRSV